MPTNPAPQRGAIVPVWVEYQGATKKSRTRKWFPNGIDEAREFFLTLAREGKRPLMIASDDVPAPRPIKKYEQQELFNMAPDQLPD